MSHFTVLVVTDIAPTDSVLDEVLAPFVEQVDRGDQYAVWNDCTDEVTKGWMGWPDYDYDETLQPKPEYATFKEYATTWRGYKQNAAGRWGHWHNPNAKWDGYNLGGAWAGSLKLKKGAVGITGWGETPPNQFDAAKVSDLVTDLATEPQFALLTANGKWHERGKMGWFGTASNEQTPEQWSAEYAKCVADIKPEQWVAIVDCHI
tara:strand:- start:92 stop:706 length:615 start_codon:yes stop_codon:yes gene_type:complete